MKLLTRQIENRFAAVGPQMKVADPIVIAKFFDPVGAGTWLATEYDPEHRIFFGFVSIFGDHNDEWGDFSLDELEAYRGPFGIGIERDRYWHEKPMSKAQVDLYRRSGGDEQ